MLSIAHKEDNDFISTHTTVDEALFSYVSNRIVEAFNPTRVILFGSYARGDAGPNSDLDIFVEMESTDRPAERRMKVRSLFRHHWWPMDIFVFTPEEVVARKDSTVSIVPSIEREGRVLFERAA